jgi:hypothetical protein
MECVVGKRIMAGVSNLVMFLFVSGWVVTALRPAFFKKQALFSVSP